MSNLFQDTKTGKLVEFINKHDKEYAMVRDAGGNIAYVNLESLFLTIGQRSVAQNRSSSSAAEPEEELLQAWRLREFV